MHTLREPHASPLPPRPASSLSHSHHSLSSSSLNTSTHSPVSGRSKAAVEAELAQATSALEQVISEYRNEVDARQRAEEVAQTEAHRARLLSLELTKTRVMLAEVVDEYVRTAEERAALASKHELSLPSSSSPLSDRKGETEAKSDYASPNDPLPDPPGFAATQKVAVLEELLAKADEEVFRLRDRVDELVASATSEAEASAAALGAEREAGRQVANLLEGKRREVEDLNVVLGKMRDELAGVDAKLSASERDREALELELATLRGSIQNMGASAAGQTSALQSHIASLEEQLRVAGAERAALTEQVNAQVSDLRERDALAAQVSVLQDSVSGAERERAAAVERYESILASSARSSDATHATLNALENEISKLTALNQELTDDNSKLTLHVLEGEQAKAKLVHAHAQMEALEADLELVSTKLEESRSASAAKISTLSTMVDSQYVEIQELQSLLAAPTSATSMETPNAEVLQAQIRALQTETQVLQAERDSLRALTRSETGNGGGGGNNGDSAVLKALETTVEEKARLGVRVKELEADVASLESRNRVLQALSERDQEALVAARSGHHHEALAHESNAYQEALAAASQDASGLGKVLIEVEAELAKTKTALKEVELEHLELQNKYNGLVEADKVLADEYDVLRADRDRLEERVELLAASSIHQHHASVSPPLELLNSMEDLPGTPHAEDDKAFPASTSSPAIAPDSSNGGSDEKHVIESLVAEIELLKTERDAAIAKTRVQAEQAGHVSVGHEESKAEVARLEREVDTLEREMATLRGVLSAESEHAGRSREALTTAAVLEGQLAGREEELKSLRSTLGASQARVEEVETALGEKTQALNELRALYEEERVRGAKAAADAEAYKREASTARSDLAEEKERGVEASRAATDAHIRETVEYAEHIDSLRKELHGLQDELREARKGPSPEVHDALQAEYDALAEDYDALVASHGELVEKAARVEEALEEAQLSGDAAAAELEGTQARVVEAESTAVALEDTVVGLEARVSELEEEVREETGRAADAEAAAVEAEGTVSVLRDQLAALSAEAKGAADAASGASVTAAERIRELQEELAFAEEENARLSGSLAEYQVQVDSYADQIQDAFAAESEAKASMAAENAALVAQLASAEAQVASLADAMQGLETQLKAGAVDSKSETTALQEELKGVYRELAEERAANSGARAGRDILERQVKELREALEEARVERASLEASAAQARVEAEVAGKRAESFGARAERSGAEAKTVASSLSEAGVKLAQAEADAAHAEREAAVARAQVSELRGANHVLSAALKDALRAAGPEATSPPAAGLLAQIEAELRSVVREKEALEARSKEALVVEETKVLNLQEQVVVLKGRVGELEGRVRAGEVSSSALQKAEGDLAALEAEMGQVAGAAAAAEERAARMEGKALRSVELEVELEEQMKLNASLQDSVGAMAAKLAEANAALSASMADSSAAAATNASTNANTAVLVESLREEVKLLQAKAGDAEEAVEATRVLSARNAELEGKIAELESTLTQLEDENGTLEAQLGSHRRALESAKSVQGSMESTLLAENKVLREEARVSRAAATELGQDKEELEGSVASLESEIATLQAAIVEYEARVDKNQAVLDAMMADPPGAKELAAALADKDEAVSKNQALSVENATLRASVEELERKMATLQRLLRDTEAGARDTQADLQDALETARGDAGAATKKASTLKTKLESAEEEVADLGAGMEKLRRKLADAEARAESAEDEAEEAVRKARKFGTRAADAEEELELVRAKMIEVKRRHGADAELVERELNEIRAKLGVVQQDYANHREAAAAAEREGERERGELVERLEEVKAELDGAWAEVERMRSGGGGVVGGGGVEGDALSMSALSVQSERSMAQSERSTQSVRGERRELQRAERLQRELDALGMDYEEALGELAAKTREIRRLKEEAALGGAEEEAGELKRQLRASREAEAELRSRVRRAEGAASEAARELKRVEHNALAASAGLENQYDDLQDRIEAQGEAMLAAQQRAEIAEQKVAGKDDQIHGLERALEQAEARLVQAYEQLRGMEAEASGNNGGGALEEVVEESAELQLLVVRVQVEMERYATEVEKALMGVVETWRVSVSPSALPHCLAESQTRLRSFFREREPMIRLLDTLYSKAGVLHDRVNDVSGHADDLYHHSSFKM